MGRQKREEPEHCEPVSIPGAPRIRAAGAPTKGIRDVQDSYGEPVAKTMPSGRPVTVEGERLIWCQGACAHSLPFRESWLACCPRCPALCCRVCREEGHATPSGGRCEPSAAKPRAGEEDGGPVPGGPVWEPAA